VSACSFRYTLRLNEGDPFYQIPVKFFCPLSGRIMLNPTTIISCGHTFEEANIRERQSDDCPLCHRKIEMLVANWELKEEMEELFYKPDLMPISVADLANNLLNYEKNISQDLEYLESLSNYLRFASESNMVNEIASYIANFSNGEEKIDFQSLIQIFEEPEKSILEDIRNRVNLIKMIRACRVALLL